MPDLWKVERFPPFLSTAYFVIENGANVKAVRGRSMQVRLQLLLRPAAGRARREAGSRGGAGKDEWAGLTDGGPR